MTPQQNRHFKRIARRPQAETVRLLAAAQASTQALPLLPRSTTIQIGCTYRWCRGGGTWSSVPWRARCAVAHPLLAGKLLRSGPCGAGSGIPHRNSQELDTQGLPLHAPDFASAPLEGGRVEGSVGIVAHNLNSRPGRGQLQHVLGAELPPSLVSVHQE